MTRAASERVNMGAMVGRLTHWMMAATLVLCACGPVTYINEVTRKANAEVEAARVARADRYAPYHFTLAVEYLHKAREEAAHSDFQAANRLGKRAAAAARRAIEIALSKAGKPRATDSQETGL